MSVGGDRTRQTMIPSRRAALGIAFGAYLLIACVITFPLITQMDTHLLGHVTSDAPEIVALAWWLKTALVIGQDPFYHRLFLYPDGLGASYLWSNLLQFAPITLLSFVLPLTTSFNVTALLVLALNGTAMFALARYVVGGSIAPAFLVGAIWLAFPTFQGHLGAAHTGLLSLGAFPLLILTLLTLRTAETRRARWVGYARAAALLPLSVWGGLTVIVYLVAPVCLLLLVRAILTDRRWWARLVVALILGGIAWLPFALPTALDVVGTRSSVFAQDVVAQDVRYSAPLVGVIAPSFYHPLFSNLGYNREALGADPFELTSYIGMVTAALALIGVIADKRARAWLVLALGAWVLSLGALLKITADALPIVNDGYATFITLPWLVLQNLPFVALTRTPARFNFTVAFALSLCAAYGVAWLWGRVRPWRWGAWIGVILLTGIMVLEVQVWFPMPTTPALLPDPIRTLGAQNDLRAVFDLPFGNPLVTKAAMLLQTGHGLPILTGQITRTTPIQPAKARLLEQSLDLHLLDDAGVDVIIVHRAWDDARATVETRVRSIMGVPVYEDAALGVYRVPPPDTTPVGFYAPSPTADAIRDPVALDFYAPTAGGALLTVTLASTDARDVIVTLDADPTALARWTISGSAEAQLWVQYGAGYHTLLLALDPSCALPPGGVYACRAVQIEAMTFAPP